MQVLIPVKVDDGMFSNEKRVEISQRMSTSPLSLFVHTSLLELKGERWFLRVHKANDEVSDNTVLLPAEAFETASRWADVQTLEPA